MKHVSSAFALIGLISMSAQALAVPFTFTPGQPARAADVNANFTELENRIQTNTNNINTNTANITANATAIAAISAPATYDIRNYLPARDLTSATFSVSNSDPTSAITYAYLPNADYSELRINVTTTPNDGYTAPPMSSIFYGITASAFTRKGRLNHNPGGAEISSAMVEPAEVIAGIPATAGASWITMTQTTTRDILTDTISSVSPGIKTANLAGIEDVTVPYNGGTTFTHCLKISTQDTGVDGIVSGGAMSWYCGGVGLVKRISVSLLSGAPNQIWQLTDLTFAAP